MRRLPVPRIAVLPLRGRLNMVSVEPYIPIVRYLTTNNRIKGVLLLVDSPGGTGGATEMLYTALKRLDERKPLFAFVTELAASGGYWASLGARRIYALRSSLVGSIGIIGFKLVLKEGLSRLGVEVMVTKKGKHKDMFFFNRPYTEEEGDKMDRLLAELYQQFVDVVVEERGLKAESVQKLATGELFTASRALEMGLIDEISDYEGALEDLAKEAGVKRESAVKVEPRRSYFRRFMQGAVSAAVDEVYYHVGQEFYYPFHRR